jgi:lysophospholipase L1-like esterase
MKTLRPVAFLNLITALLALTTGRSAEPIAAFTPGARILFQGDSITDGARGRSPDPNHILGHGYVFVIAARHGAAFPDARLEFINRGVSGNTVLDLEKRWQTDTLEQKPDILSILIGVNDQARGVPPEQYEETYDQLITKAQTANPRLKLVLGEPFVKPAGTVDDGIRQRQEIVARLAQKHGAALVRFQRVFDEAAKRAPADYWIWDSVHPTYRGHQLMADEWERVVREFWKPGDPGPAQPITVASYYFGNYHPGDPRNTAMKGPTWSEWELVKAAQPRFPGHRQPKVPLWGYRDESDPAAMAQKIAAAADHGIDAFIFDWYYYDDGPFLDRPIDRGFLQATNNHRLKFAFMWANHDWAEIQPYKLGTPQRVLFPGKVAPATFARIADHLIKDYFPHPSYWRIEGRPYFSFYELTKLLESFGSVQATRAALDEFRARARAAGLPGLHLNAVVWGQPILPQEKKPADAAQLVRDLGFDSVTSYVWIHHVPLPTQVTDFNFVRDEYFKYWDQAVNSFGVPYFPNVSMGWDSSPRAAQEDEFGNFGYPFTNTVGNNTPDNFRVALERTKERLLAQPGGPRILNINCWNEWTEGSYLEPDTVNGFKYLEAVQAAFGAKP